MRRGDVFGDCWASAKKRYIKDYYIASGAFILMFVLLLFAISTYISPELRNMEIWGTYTVPELLIMLVVLLFFIFLIFVVLYALSKSKNLPHLIDCLRSYYSTTEDEHFEDFKWIVAIDYAIIIDFAMHPWLIVPDARTLKIITPCKSKYANISIGYVLQDMKDTEAIRTYTGLKGIEGPLFTFIQCSSPQERPDLCADAQYYMGKWYVCSDDESCNIAKEIIKGLAIHGKNIKGISLRGLKEGTYLGIYAKMPKSNMEFEEILSYAADLKSLFVCESD